MHRKYLTFANVTSLLALFIALSAGSYAALKIPKNSVGSAQLKAKAVTRAKIAANAVDGTKIAADAIDGSKVKDGTLSGSDINVAALAKVPSATAADTAGSAAISRVKIVTASATANDTSGTPLTATCDAGLNVVGGGGSVADGNKGFVNDGYPSAANAWTAHFYAYSGQTVGAVAYAICAPAAATG